MKLSYIEEHKDKELLEGDFKYNNKLLLSYTKKALARKKKELMLKGEIRHNKKT